MRSNLKLQAEQRSEFTAATACWQAAAASSAQGSEGQGLDHRRALDTARAAADEARARQSPELGR